MKHKTKNQRFLACPNQHSYLNKRADIPITILVIGVFVVCTLALLSFFTMNIKEKNSFVGVKLMQKLNYQIEKYFVSQEITDLDIKTNSQGQRVFYQEKKDTDGWWFFEKEVTLFYAEYGLE